MQFVARGVVAVGEFLVGRDPPRVSLRRASPCSDGRSPGPECTQWIRGGPPRVGPSTVVSHRGRAFLSTARRTGYSAPSSGAPLSARGVRPKARHESRAAIPSCRPDPRIDIQLLSNHQNQEFVSESSRAGPGTTSHRNRIDGSQAPHRARVKFPGVSAFYPSSTWSDANERPQPNGIIQRNFIP